MEWYLKVLNNYFNFKGRARRKEYWMFILYNLIFSIIIILVENMLNWNFKITIGEFPELQIGIISTIYSLFILTPSLAVMTRRLHDTGKSGFWIFLLFAPYLSFIFYFNNSIFNVIYSATTLVTYFIFIRFLLTNSSPEINKYGKNPKEVPY
ncbi:MAG: DUF805 domain-containing protein [Bacilli bacterium]